MSSTPQPFHEELPLLPPSKSRDAIDSRPSNGSEHSQSPTPRDTQSSKKHTYSLFVAICFSLNYSIGSGILGLPYEYYNSGFLLGTILLILLGLLTYITYTYIVDGMQRAEAITTLSQQFYITKHKLLSDPQYIKETLKGISVHSIKSQYKLQRNEYQLSELIGMFGGKWWRLSYDISFGISTLIALWSYSALFGVSLARNIGIPGISTACDMELSGSASDCRGLYSLYVVIFFIWTIIMSLMDFTEQQAVQIFATFARFLIIFLMVFTAIGLIYSGWYYQNDVFHYDSSTKGEIASGVNSWKWSGMAYMIAVAAFAYGNQYCVTDIIQPLTLSDRSTKQHTLWMWAVGICVVVYIFCGVTISVYFGPATQSPCTLAWRGFSGFTDSGSVPVWASMISWFIVLFPAIDIGSAYPLNAVTLANTLEAAILPNRNKIKKGDIDEFELKDNNADNNINIDDNAATGGIGGGGNAVDISLVDQHDNDDTSSWRRLCKYENRYNVLFRVLICTSTCILALIEWNFDLILAISGAFGLLAVFGGPCVLEWKSRQMIAAITGDTVTAHKTPLTKNWTSHNSWLITIAGTSIIAFIAVFVDLIQRYS